MPKRFRSSCDPSPNRADKSDSTRHDFKSFGDNSLDGGVVHIVPDAGSSTDMNVQQRVDVTLMREMATRSIELALPTRTAHIVPIEASLNRVSAPEPLPCRDVDTKGDAA